MTIKQGRVTKIPDSLSRRRTAWILDFEMNPEFLEDIFNFLPSQISYVTVSKTTEEEQPHDDVTSDDEQAGKKRKDGTCQ